MGSDSWVADYHALEQAGDSIMEQIAEMTRVLAGGGEGRQVNHIFCSGQLREDREVCLRESGRWFQSYMRVPG